MVAPASVEEYLAGRSPEAVEAKPSRTVVYWKRERVFAGAHVNGRRLELVVDLLREADHPLLLSAFRMTKRIVTHRLRVTESEQLDNSIQPLLQEAYDDVGPGTKARV